MRGAFRSSKHIPVNKQPVPDARNGLDLECLTALFSEMSQPADDTMDCVVADDPPIPASIDQFIPRDDLTLDAGKNDKNLHHSRFERLRANGGSCARTARPGMVRPSCLVSPIAACV